MVTLKRLEKLLATMSTGPSLWDDNRMNVANAARKARVDHTIEMLMQLGYDDLAAELLRLERNMRTRPATIEFTRPPEDNNNLIENNPCDYSGTEQSRAARIVRG
jgi:hypothetical protein